MRFTRIVSVFLAAILVISLFSGVAIIRAATGGTITLPQTGQADSYHTGDDGDLKKGEVWPGGRFQNNNDGTITDLLTGLMWLQYTGDYKPTWEFSWAQAFGFVTDLNLRSDNFNEFFYNDHYSASYTDWRVPNINELESLINYNEPDWVGWLGDQGFDINPGIYWSSTADPDPNTPGRKYQLNGAEEIVSQTETFSSFCYILPVRGPVNAPGYEESLVWKTGQTTSYGAGDDGALQQGADWPAPRFVDNGDGTVSDKLTGLIWLKDPTSLNNRSWEFAFDVIDTLNQNPTYFNSQDYSAAFPDWRMPNAKELYSLMDYSQTTLAPDAPFIGVSQKNFWSSTSAYTRYGATYAWLISTYTGMPQVMYPKTMGAYVWPVREVPPPITVTEGDQNPLLSKVTICEENVLALHAVIGTTTEDDILIDQITFGVSGNGVDNQDIAVAHLYLGSLDGDETANATYTSDNGALTFSVDLTIPKGDSLDVFLTYDFVPEKASPLREYKTTLTAGGVNAKPATKEVLDNPPNPSAPVTGDVVIDEGIISILSGDNQWEEIEKPLHDPLKVQVTCEHPDSIDYIRFEVIAGDADGALLSNGAISHDVTVDASGIAEETLTLGTKPGADNYQVRATLVSIDPPPDPPAFTVQPKYVIFKASAGKLTVTAQHDGTSADDMEFSTFIYNIDAQNLITADLDLPPGRTADQVTFEYGMTSVPGTVVSPNKIYTATFNMGELATEKPLKVTVTTDDGRTMTKTYAAKAILWPGWCDKSIVYQGMAA